MFAGRLLVSRKELKKIEIRSAIDGVISVSRIALERGVSKETAARELIQLWPHLTVSLISKNVNNRGWLVDWCVRGLDPAKVVRKKRLDGNDPELSFKKWETILRGHEKHLDVAKALIASERYIFTAFDRTPTLKPA